MDAIVAKLNQERHEKDEAAERIRRALPTYLPKQRTCLAQHLPLPMPMHAGAMPEGPTWKRKHLLADYASVVHSDDPNQMAQASSHPLTMIALPQTLVPATTPRSPSLHRPTALTLTAMVTVKVTSSPATQGRC
ncbi:hypothetical protein LCI18_012935 [Fusarium solani-melongenae]|uniref:Uncharacterized protein n=1 Tax=Fusarium solani subsp. cucurbitae TaxID=2747967 RepID=A0ACD3ZLB0_FUSSC|nr:hypothetical protein LCI18_012935 [Fusarium solani-melongenae]